MSDDEAALNPRPALSTFIEVVVRSQRSCGESGEI